MYEVELIGLSLKYGSQTVLHNVSVSFRKNKITAIVGRSGSGKSTLLKSIAGILKPFSGNIKSPHSVGYVIQGNGLFPHLTVEENISLPGKLAGSVDPGRTGELLKFTDLPDHYRAKYPHELSGGEQQRVAICRALFRKPPVLLMDEPFASLDTLTRRNLHEKILELNRSTALTIIIVTHDVAEAVRLADDILVLDHGKVQQFGSRDEVMKSPANDFVKRLLEASII